jgi:hypothetical protein
MLEQKIALDQADEKKTIRRCKRCPGEALVYGWEIQPG